jgi:hypothetical protein
MQGDHINCATISGVSTVTKTLGVVWGARNIGKVINRTERQTHHLLETGAIEVARKIGAMWTASEAGLRRQFCAADAEQDDAA